MSKCYIGINQIEIDPKEFHIKDLLELIEVIQSHHEDTTLQFFNDRYILNPEHIFHACYFVQKAFYTKMNISNKKNLELLLYLAANRQIKLSLEYFGVNHHNFLNKRISYCIISSEDKFKQVSSEINRYLHSKDISINFKDLSIEKYHRVKKYYGFSNNQILIVLRSYGYKNDILDISSVKIEKLYETIQNL